MIRLLITYSDGHTEEHLWNASCVTLYLIDVSGYIAAEILEYVPL